MSLAVLGVVITVLTYGVILVLGLWGWYYWTHRALIREAGKLPTMLPRWPLVGSALYTIGSLNDITGKVVEYFEEAARRGVYTYCFWAGPIPLIIVAGAEDIKKLLNSSLHQGYEVENYLKEFLGYGLLTAPADHWKMTRRHMNPVFHPNNCGLYVPVFNKNSRELVSRLSKHVGKGPVDVVDYVMETALKSVCHFTFGQDMDFDVEAKDFQQFLHTVESIPGILCERVIKFWLKSDTTYRFLRRGDIKAKNDTIRRFFESSIKKAQEKKELEKKKTQLENKIPHDGHNDHENSQDNDLEPVTVVDAYSVLRANNSNVTEKHFHEELLTTLITGADTVSTSVSFALLLLGQYQEIQDKLYKEITSVLGPEDDVLLEDVNRMPYLEQVIKETLRFIEIIPFVTRTLEEEIKLSSVTVPAGTTVYLCLGGLHMDPNVYPDPEKFDPDRFALNGSTKIDDKTYIPFSRGPRSCIGKSYAQIFMRIALVHLVKKYHITTKMDFRKIKKRYIIALASGEGVHLSLNSRC